MLALSLAEIAVACEGALETVGDDSPDTVVKGAVDTDSRVVVDGGIFFALRGEVTDGHLFASAALENGAALIIVEHRLELPVTQIVVADAATALAALARTVVARVRVRGKLTVIGITGSNGKTTTKNLLREVLRAAGPTIAPEGSFNNHIGAPLSMLGVDADTRYLIVEMGASGVGEIEKLVNIAMPDIAVVLKVGLAHAGEFGGISATQRAKAEIVTQLPASAVAVLNADDDRVAAMAEQTAANVRWFGLAGAPDVAERDTGRPRVTADDVELTASGTSFTLVIGNRRFPVLLRILGEHHVMNALAAITVASELGIDTEKAIEAIEAVPRAERWRMEVLEPSPGITVINDAYNASPDSTAAALKTLAQLTRGERRGIAVLGEMAELGEYADEEHDRIGRLVVRLNIGQLVVVGHAARHIHNAAALEGSWDGESVLVATADEAFALLRDELRAGDVLLVKSSKSAGLRFLGDRLGGVPR